MLTGLIESWSSFAVEFGEISISGWRGFEGSNTMGEDISSIDGFISSFYDDPPRVLFSAKTAGKALELSIDYLRRATTQILVRMPTNKMVDDVLGVLDLNANNHINPPQGVVYSDLSHEEPTGRADLCFEGRQPVDIDNPAQLARHKMNDAIALKLSWGNLDAEEFERLLYNIMANAGGYANPR